MNALHPDHHQTRLRKQRAQRRRIHLRALAVADQHGLCIYCQQRFSETRPATLEHIVPRAMGGDDHPSNVAASCDECNGARGTANHTAFMRYRRREQ